MSGFKVDPRQVLRAIQQIDKQKGRIENNALRAGGTILKNRMKSNVNRSNKNQIHIQDDIEVSRVKERDGKKYVEVGPSPQTRWRAKFLEFGTSKMSAKPFIDKSAVESERAIIRTMESEIRRGLKL